MSIHFWNKKRRFPPVKYMVICGLPKASISHILTILPWQLQLQTTFWHRQCHKKALRRLLKFKRYVILLILIKQWVYFWNENTKQNNTDTIVAGYLWGNWENWVGGNGFQGQHLEKFSYKKTRTSIELQFGDRVTAGDKVFFHLQSASGLYLPDFLERLGE